MGKMRRREGFPVLVHCRMSHLPSSQPCEVDGFHFAKEKTKVGEQLTQAHKAVSGRSRIQALLCLALKPHSSHFPAMCLWHNRHLILSWGWWLDGPSPPCPSPKITQGLDTKLQSGKTIFPCKCLK